ncbi:hypothetical protein [Novosphingobium sp. JCM 18896]|uniref:hypothetical protein n=1 Tax=Novosphingobium sp. JCM 18896 TaxID=2989731 RepID=UPI0022232EB7|nr:hypothetical protein [Novosphingobium sp. JCM 18896]MCW1432441.1 hypothetical protein [Novosphingobium sp. JCM 18896]
MTFGPPLDLVKRPRLLTRDERLARWAELLAREPDEIFQLLPPKWIHSRLGFDDVSIEDTPLEIAWRDPIFRVDGLAKSTVQELREYFELSDRELDRIVGGSWKFPCRPSWQVVRRIQNVSDPRRERLLFAGVVMLAILVSFLPVMFA